VDGALDDALNLVLAYCDHHYTEVRPGVAAGENLPELLREALERAAEARGAEALVRHRPGAWEADWLMRVLGYERDWRAADSGWTNQFSAEPEGGRL
jgi:hypothetical protein